MGKSHHSSLKVTIRELNNPNHEAAVEWLELQKSQDSVCLTMASWSSCRVSKQASMMAHRRYLFPLRVLEDLRLPALSF